MNLAELSQKSPSEEEVYQALRRSLQRRKGFGIVFVQCSPATATRLIARVKSDISQKKIAVLSLTEPIENLYNLVEARPDKDELNILIIQGLEKSLEPYITPGYGGEGDYYTLSNLPPILGHLNQRRDGFLDRFPHLCFVFVLPLFAIKYLIQRSPDFFDWGGGIFEIPSDSELIEKESLRILLEGNYNKYLNWTQLERDRKIAEIQCWISEPNQTSERKAQLFLKQGNLFAVSNEYEAAIFSYDQALKYKPDDDIAWYFRGSALNKLQRYKEAIASFDLALNYKPDFHEAWYIRGTALDKLGRYQEAINSYDRALVVNPNFDGALPGRCSSFAHLNLYQESIESLYRALKIKAHDSDTYLLRGRILKSLEQNECNRRLARNLEGLNTRLQSALGNIENSGQFELVDKEIQMLQQVSNEFTTQAEVVKQIELVKKKIQRFQQTSLVKKEMLQQVSNEFTTQAEVIKQKAQENLMLKLAKVISCFDKALEMQPRHSDAYYGKASCYALQRQTELAIATLKQAIALDPKYREMAKTDADFDGVRSDDRFQALLKD